MCLISSYKAPVSLRGTRVQRLLGEFVNGSLPPTKAECRCTGGCFMSEAGAVPVSKDWPSSYTEQSVKCGQMWNAFLVWN